MRILKPNRMVNTMKIFGLGMGLLLWGSIWVVVDQALLRSLVLTLPGWLLISAIVRLQIALIKMGLNPVRLSKAGLGELRVKLASLKEVVVKLPADLQEVVNALTTRALKVVNQIDADMAHDSGALKWTTQQEQLRQVFEELLPPLLNAFIKVSAAGAVEEGEAAPVPSKERVFLEEQLKAIGGRLAVFEGEHLRYREECFRTHKEALVAYLERTGSVAKELKTEKGELLGVSTRVSLGEGYVNWYDTGIIGGTGVGVCQAFAGESEDVPRK